MSTRDTSSWIEQLERARAELEAALAGHADWRVLRRTTTRAALERTLAENPVYRTWGLLGDLIEAMRAESAHSAAGAASGLAASGAEHGRGRRLSLRDVLASVRVGGADAFDERPAAPLVIHDPEPPVGESPTAAKATDQANNGWRPAPDETEEATVSFVVCEPPTRPVPFPPQTGPHPSPTQTGSDSSPHRSHIGRQVGAKGPHPVTIDRQVGAEGPDRVTNPAQDTGDEAEVTIVPRRR